MKRLFPAILVAAMSLSGCGAKESFPRFTIVTSFYPMYIMTANIVKDVPGVKLINMAPPFSGCLHDYQMTPQDMKTLSRADVLVINGAGMESFLDEVIKQSPKLSVIDASRGIELIEHQGTVNPHIFASISGAMAQVRNIAAGLETVDLLHTLQYRNNAALYLARLESLRSRMQLALKDIKNRNIITFHEAFSYFAREFNLKILAVIEREPGSEPSAGELAKTIEIVKNNKVKALFAEPQYPTQPAQIIAGETGAKVYPLDPVVTGPVDDRDYYITAMEKNLATLQQALH